MSIRGGYNCRHCKGPLNGSPGILISFGDEMCEVVGCSNCKAAHTIDAQAVFGDGGRPVYLHGESILSEKKHEEQEKLAEVIN